MAWAKTIDEAKALLARAEVKELQIGGIGAVFLFLQVFPFRNQD